MPGVLCVDAGSSGLWQLGCRGGPGPAVQEKAGRPLQLRPREHLQVEASELHFLILHFLAAGPCQRALRVLEEEAAQHGLLPARTDIFGGSSASFLVW